MADPAHDRVRPVRARLRRHVGAAAMRTPVGMVAYRGFVRERSLRRIAESGIFDQQWYELQTGTAFPNPGAALRDYVSRGRRAGLTPAPLFNPSWYEPGVWRHRIA